jgi:cytochrome oxidase assembly protein ShyY1
MPAGYAFRPRAWAFALAAAGCAAGIALGNWQTERAAQKRAAAAAATPASLKGELLPKFTILLTNRFYQGKSGYYVVQPLRLVDGRQVLVNRGWLRADAGEPKVATPAGEVAVQGLRQEHLPRTLEAGISIAGSARQNMTVEAFAAWSGLRLEPWVLEQHSALEDGLVRDWPRAGNGVEMHESYALQWYSLAALSLILFVALNFKKIGKRNP